MNGTDGRSDGRHVARDGNMKIRIVSLATAFAVAGSLVGGLDYGSASAATNQAPVVTSGAVTVTYESVYTIHFTASDDIGAIELQVDLIYAYQTALRACVKYIVPRTAYRGHGVRQSAYCEAEG